MYQIDHAVAALPPTIAVRDALQAYFFPSNLRIDKLPLPDNDRDMMAMKLEGLLTALACQAALVDRTGPEGFLDPGTGRMVSQDYLGTRLINAVKEVQQLTTYLALNDAWRARGVRPIPKSAAIDLEAQAAVVDATLLPVAAPAVDERPVVPEEVYAVE